MAVTKGATEELNREISSVFAKVFRAYLECSDEIQRGIREMIEIINDPNSDSQERDLALDTLVEALFPQYDDGVLGIEIEEADRACVENQPDGADAQEELDREEEVFSNRLKKFMEEKSWTQADLAERAGVQQPAISMMLNRRCRPQQRTVRKLAEALGIEPRELWPF